MVKLHKSIHPIAFVIVSYGLLALVLIQTWHMLDSVQSVSKFAHSAGVTVLNPTEPAAVAVPAPIATPAPAVTAKSKPKATTQTAAIASPTSDIASANDCAGQDQIAQTSSVLLCMTNYARHFHGLGSVSISAILADAAVAKAGDIVTCQDFSHTACGHASNYWITTKGYGGNCSGENIAKGQTTPGKVFVAWMNSSGHRANILGPNYRDLGVAEQSDGGQPVWVMELGGC